MRVGIGFGRERLELEVRDENFVPVHRHAVAPPLADAPAAVREALEKPHGFPALNRAVIPDDHVVIVVDDTLPHLAALLTPILDHLARARVEPSAITLLCPASSVEQPWVDELPEIYEDVRIEVHDPADRRHLAYLATTKHGRRIYLNRTAVDADQLVLLTARGYDSLTGYSGAEAALFPALSDGATQQEASRRPSMAVPGEAPWPWRREAAEVAWHLGAPFLVQIIQGADEQIVHVVGGSLDSVAEGSRLLDRRWRVEVERAADLVVAGIGGDPAQHSFADLARAWACAARVVKPKGRIVLLTQAEPLLGQAAEVLRRQDEPAAALAVLEEVSLQEREPLFHWATAAEQASLYLLSGLHADVAEELFTVPLDEARQVQRMLGEHVSCIVLEDAQRTLACIRKESA